jgi:acylpyruvate hydrolase
MISKSSFYFTARRLFSTTELPKTPSKIICIGRNFSDHAKELGNAIPTSPFFFLKPQSSLLSPGGNIILPRSSSNVQHEVEITAVIGKKGKNIKEADALSYVAGYTLALDITARDLQNKVKEKGLPWTVAKGVETLKFNVIGFDTFTPLSRQLVQVKDIGNVDLWLKVNGELKQNGNTKDLLFKLPFLISHISKIMTLEEGDVILTGTPAGVAKLVEGDGE